jgi:hypothetical protein
MVYTTSSYCEKARLTSAGFAYFHSRMDLPGNNSDSLSAMGQLMARFPQNTIDTKACPTPSCSATLCCVIRFMVRSIIYPKSICQGFFITNSVFLEYFLKMEGLP